MRLIGFEQVLTSRLLSIRIFNLLYGMLAARTRFDLYGGITSRIPKASSSLLIATIVNEW